MLGALLVIAGLVGCEKTADDTGAAGDGGAADGGAADGGAELEPPGEEVASSVARETEPDASAADIAQLTADDADFGLALYRELAAEGDGNLFLSPHSISVALAMTYAGAEGATQTQMADALRFSLPEARLHPAFNALDWALQSRAELDPEIYEAGDGFRLSIVNQLFGQTGFSFEAAFLDTLALHYGAGLRLLDFATNAEGSRVLINDWVEAVTEERIVDLLPEGSISEYTRLVLVNAIYFKASWQAPFDPVDTAPASFSTLGGGTVTADTMHGSVMSRCGAGEGYAVAELPYVGDALTMTLLVPDVGRFGEVEAALDGEALQAALSGLEACLLTVAMPKFSFRHAFNAKDPLIALGMVDAFGGEADFSGVTTADALSIGGVYHQAFVALDEEGTEAAAATAVVEDGTGVPEEVTLTVDRPFLFLIRDAPTGAVLFLGRVADPTG